MASIFICYSRESENLVGRLASDIEALGHDAWFDQQLTGGQAWWDQILQRIRLADAIAVALSPGMLESVACKREYSYAIRLGKPLLPVLVAAEVRTSLLPPALAAYQYVDYADPNREAVLRLGRALTKLPQAGDLPHPLPAEPDVPMSYLGDLRERLEATTELDYGAQTALLLDLKKAVSDPQTGDDAAYLVAAFKKRPRLYANVADELQELLDRHPPQADEAEPATAGQLGTAPKPDLPAESSRTTKRQGIPPGVPETARFDETAEDLAGADTQGEHARPSWSSVRPSTTALATTLVGVLAAGLAAMVYFGAPPSAPDDAPVPIDAELARLQDDQSSDEAEPRSVPSDAGPPLPPSTSAPSGPRSFGIDVAPRETPSGDGSTTIGGDTPVERDPPSERPSEESGDADRRALITEVQEELVRLFLLAPPADGIAGPATRAAVRDFKEWQGVTVDEEIDQGLLVSLRDVPSTEPARLGAARSPARTHDVAPAYPPDALAAGVQGVVILEAVIGPSGRVVDASVLRSVPLLDDAAISSVRQWRYTPTLLDGVPVPVILTATVNFRLTEPIVWRVYAGTGPEREPLAGASVVLSDAGGSHLGESTTGADGEFRASLPDQEFVVTVTAQGHKTLRIIGVPGGDVAPRLPAISLELERGAESETVTRTWEADVAPQ